MYCEACDLRPEAASFGSVISMVRWRGNMAIGKTYVYVGRATGILAPILSIIGVFGGFVPSHL